MAVEIFGVSEGHIFKLISSVGWLNYHCILLVQFTDFIDRVPIRQELPRLYEKMREEMPE